MYTKKKSLLHIPLNEHPLDCDLVLKESALSKDGPFFVGDAGSPESRGTFGRLLANRHLDLTRADPKVLVVFCPEFASKAVKTALEKLQKTAQQLHEAEVDFEAIQRDKIAKEAALLHCGDVQAIRQKREECAEAAQKVADCEQLIDNLHRKIGIQSEGVLAALQNFRQQETLKYEKQINELVVEFNQGIAALYRQVQTQIVPLLQARASVSPTPTAPAVNYGTPHLNTADGQKLKRFLAHPAIERDGRGNYSFVLRDLEEVS